MPRYIVTGHLEGHVTDEILAENENDAADIFVERADRGDYTGGFYPEDVDVIEIELADESEDEEFVDDEEVNG